MKQQGQNETKATNNQQQRIQVISKTHQVNQKDHIKHLVASAK